VILFGLYVITDFALQPAGLRFTKILPENYMFLEKLLSPGILEACIFI
jgi:hypothetical protein